MIFTINWVNIKSALVSALITAVLAIAGYIIGIGDVFKLDLHTLINVASISGLTALVSIIKSYFTTNDGNFLGAISIK